MGLRSIQDQDAATGAEVRQAIEDLPLSSLHQLRTYAEYKSLGLAEDGQDLLSESLLLTLNGQRKWRKDIPFWLHLQGVVKSLASHARSKQTKEPAHEEQIPERIQNAATPDHLHKRLDFEDQIRLLETSLADDEDALLVLECWKDGMVPSEIQDLLSMSVNDLETIQKRIRRRAKKRVS